MITLPTDIKGLETLVLGLIAELEAALKARLGMNSTNSHKPPTSDGLSKPPTMPRGKGGKVGGQKGHKGHHLKMVQDPASIDAILPYYPTACGLCGQNSYNEASLIATTTAFQ
jgi:transposase